MRMFGQIGQVPTVAGTGLDHLSSSFVSLGTELECEVTFSTHARIDIDTG